MPSLTYNDIPLVYDFENAAQGFLDRYQRLEDLIPPPNTTSHYNWQNNPASNETGTGQDVGLPRYNWPERPPLRINQLYWPSGATRFSYGLFLLTSEQKDEILDLDCDTGYTLKSSYETVPSEEQDENGSEPIVIEFENMFYLTPRKITSCGDEDQLWLLPVVDQRYWWQFKDCGDIRSQLQSETSECEIYCSATWTTLIDYAMTRVSSSYTLASLDPDYQAPDCTAFVRPYHNIAVLIDAIAASIGCRVVSRLDGYIEFQDPGQLAAVYSQNIQDVGNQVAGTKCLDATQRHVPETVRVTFPKSYCYHLTCNDEKYTLDYTITPATGQCTVEGAVKTIHSTAVADYQCACLPVTPVNYSTLGDLAGQIGLDWHQWHTAEYDMSYAVPQPWNPTGMDDHVLWTFGHESFDFYEPITSVNPGVTGESTTPDVSLNSVFRRNHFTRVQSLPPTCDIDSMFHSVAATVLPDEILVKVDGCWTYDDCCTPATLPKNTGTVVKWCDCDYAEVAGRQIPIYSSVGFLCEEMSALKSEIANGDCIPIKEGCCEYLWAKWNCKDNRWEVEAKYDDLWRFELDSELCCGSSAPATLLLDCCGEGLAATSVTFTVTDTMNLACCARQLTTPPTLWVEAEECIMPGDSGKLASQLKVEGGVLVVDDDADSVEVDNSDCYIIALTGDRFPVIAANTAADSSDNCIPAGRRGVARFWPDSCEFEVLSIQSCAPISPSSSLGAGEAVLPAAPFGMNRRVFIDSQLDCDETQSVDVYTVDEGGSWVDTLCDITVRNNSNRTIACDADEYAMATLVVTGDECTVYVTPEQRPLRATATLTQVLCGTGAAVIQDITYPDVCNWQTRLTITAANNPHGLWGCVGDTVELAWNDEACDWDIIQVSHHEEYVVTDLACSDLTGCTINKIAKRAAIMTCECDAYHEDEALTGTLVDVVSSVTLDCVECELVLNTKQVCSFCNTPGSGTNTAIAFETVDIVTGISSSCGDGSGGAGGECSTSLTTSRFCVLGCDTGETGTAVAVGTAVDIMTDAVLTLDANGLCLTPWFATVCVLCGTTDAAGDEDCASVIDCDASGGS